MLFVTFLTGIYYNVIISWAVHYFFSGMMPNLPWDGCEHYYNTPRCQDRNDNNTCGWSANQTGEARVHDPV